MAANGDEEFQRWFLDLGMQYYVSGRLAGRAGQVPVHGNLLHHAVEMFLKAALVGTATPKELRDWGHHVPTLWKKFRARYKDEALDQFDTTVSALHNFEAIRYPDKLVTEGMFGAITWAPRPATEALGPGHHPPRYEIIINEVDGLMLDVLRHAEINPKYFGNQLMGGEAREAVTYQNPRAAEWLPD